MSNLDVHEKMDMLVEARDHLQAAIDLLEEVFPDDGYVQAYMIDYLKIKVSNDHGFLSSDLNMDNLMEMVEGDSDDDDFDEEE
jgi:hypothetical protein